MPDITSTLRFWLINSIGWVLFCALSLAMSGAFGAGASSGGTLISVGLAIALCGVSGGVRALALARHWWRLEVGALAMRLGMAVVLGAALAQLLLTAVLQPALALGWVDFAGRPADFRPLARVFYWLNTVLVLGLWTAVWAGLHSVRRARHAELARLRAEAERNALERDALRARLNPHFVFNALNNLRALILEDPERARDMVTRLSRTLRQALAHNRSEQVTLAEELAVVDDYLAIESIHFEQRLQVQRHINADALQAQLPAMALQLLVENAIKHGIAQRPGGGEVQIHAALDHGVLRLQVDNPRAGDRVPPHGHGVGLAYLHAQLGPRGRFTLRPAGEGMQALLEIPQ